MDEAISSSTTCTVAATRVVVATGKYVSEGYTLGEGTIAATQDETDLLKFRIEGFSKVLIM